MFMKKKIKKRPEMKKKSIFYFKITVFEAQTKSILFQLTMISGEFLDFRLSKHLFF